MKPGRFRILWVMGIIAFIAIDFGTIRALSDMSFRAYVNGSPLTSQMIGALIFGAIPMANILVLGLLIKLRLSGNRPFLLGFEIFGAFALFVYIAGIGLFPDLLVKPLYDQFTRNVMPHFQDGPFINTKGIIALYSLMTAALTLPQLTFALIGGSLFRGLSRGRVRQVLADAPAQEIARGASAKT